MSVRCVWGGINFSVFEVDTIVFKSRRTGKSRCSFLNMDVLTDKCKCVVRVRVVRIWVVRRYKFFGLEVNSLQTMVKD